MAQILGIVVVIGLTFLVAWLAARTARSAGLLLAVWGGTVLAAIVAYGLAILTSYDALYDGREIEQGLNAFWYSVFHSTDAALWATGVGLVAAGVALLFAGGPARPAAVEWSAGPPTSGAPPSAGPPWQNPPTPTDAPAAPWTAVPPRDDITT